VISDGHRAVVTRFCSDLAESPPTLYYFVGKLYPDGRTYDPAAAADPVIVSSERLTADDGWNVIPGNHMMLIERNRPPELRDANHLCRARPTKPASARVV
jgi:hypothetical protein